MADNRDYMTRQEEMGAIQISEDVVASIAINAAKETEGVSGFMNANMPDLMGGKMGAKKLTARGVRVDMTDDKLTVNLFIIVRYGNSIGDVAKKVQQVVYAALEGMTGFQISAVNVHVGGISFN